MKDIRIGVIGCGIIAQYHLETYAAIPGVKVAAICDIDEKTLDETFDKWKDKLGIEAKYQNFRDLLARDDIIAVDVCLHNNLHAPVTIEALRNGKHAYCEKPMAGAWKDAEAMLKTAGETGKMLHIQLATLYLPETRAAKKLIDAGRLGHIYHARSKGYRRMGRPFVDGYATKEFNSSHMAAGGALFDMGVYHISQLLYLLCRPALQTVTGSAYQEMDMDKTRREISGFDVEELGVGFARYEKGLTMDIIESWSIHMDDFGASFLAGSKGGIRLSPFSFHTFENDIIMETKADLKADEYRNRQLNPGLKAYSGSQEHWVAVLRGEADLWPTAEIALDTSLLSEGIYLSSGLSREVTAEEIRAKSKSHALTSQDTPMGLLNYEPVK